MITKARVHEALLQHQASIIEELENLRKRYQSAIDMDEEDTKDIEDLARQDSTTDLLHHAEMQLAQAENDLMKLKNLLPIQTETVTLGSLVITEKYKFYVSIANHSFYVADEEYIGLASDAPLYSFMKGKKAGEQFSFNQQSYTIQQIL